MCDVCLFRLAGSAYCPDCATAGPSAAERSKVFSGGLLSVALAVVGFAVVVGLVAAGAAGMAVPEPASTLLSYVWTGCSIAGLGTGLVSREGARRTGSVLPLIGIVANGLSIAVLAVFMVIGLSQ